MRKACIVVGVLMILSMMSPVSAATTGKWDFGAGQASAQRTIQQMINESMGQLDWTSYVWDSGMIEQFVKTLGK